MPLPAEIASVPTLADLNDKWGLRKEALRSLSDVEKSAALSAGFDRLMASLGKRAKRPVTLIDDYAKQMICEDASASALGWRRGLNPRAGQDEWILTELTRIDAQYQDVRTGKIEFYYEDSTPVVDEQGPIGGGDVTADAWAKCSPRCGCG